MALFTYTVFIKMYVEINDGREDRKGRGGYTRSGEKEKREQIQILIDKSSNVCKS